MSRLNLLKLSFQVAVFVTHLSLVSGDCVKLDLGMESGSIPDSNITASTEQSTSNTPAKNGRLNFASGSSWCAATSDSNPYLQIDLQTLHIICAVSTQGNSQADQWVTNYTLQTSTDGITWTDYTEDGQIKVLKGNENRNSEVKHVLYEGILARYLRFLPKIHYGAVCLRTEVFGVKLKPGNLALGRPTKQSTTYNNSFIGIAGPERAVDGNDNTDMRNKHCSHTDKNNNRSWWRVDLGSDKVPVSDIHIVNRFSVDPGLQELYFGGSTTVTSNPKCWGRFNFFNFKASAICFIQNNEPLRTGRYVFIRTKNTNTNLQLCEVEVYSRENLAFDKQTAQISTGYGAKSKLAVDGNSSTNYYQRSCTHTSDTSREPKPWWRVDLGQVEPVSEVYIVNRGDAATHRLSNFEIRIGSTASGGGVTNPKCGTGPYSVPEGRGVSFFCRPPLYGRYVTIRSLLINEPLTLCEVEVYSERRACPMQAIGVASSDAFPNNSFSASSYRSGNEPHKGRLLGVGAWSPSTDTDHNDYLQIDLQHEYIICAVASQGSSAASHRALGYKLQLSLTGTNWVIYQENGVDRVFNADRSWNGAVKQSLKEYASAMFIRFQPTANYFSHKALRVEVFGVLLSTAPSQAPSGFSVAASSSTSITASWQLPPEYARHGIITGFKLFHKEKDSGGSPMQITINDGENRTKEVTGLSRYTEYEFQVLAFTSDGDGPKSSVLVERTNEDEPSVGPDNVSFSKVNESTFNISWAPLPREKSYSDVIRYEVKEDLLSRGKRRKRSPISSRTINTTTTYVVLHNLLLCARYDVSVRAYTRAGPGPYSEPVKLETSKPEAPSDFKATNLGSTQVTLEWKEPELITEDGLRYTVEYTGTKSYDDSFLHKDVKKAVNSTTLKVENLVPGSEYKFEVYGMSVCGKSTSIHLNVKTEVEAPIAPVVLNLIYETVSKSVAGINLWPALQRNGPISAYQVIVLKVTGGTEELPDDFDSKLKDDDNKDNLNFYIAAEIRNNPVQEESWKFTVGDGQTYGTYENKGLDRGENYVVYQRAITNNKGDLLKGKVSKVATISVIGVPPNIIEDLSPSSVICERQTLCSFSCHAISDTPFNYSWTKNDQVPVGENIKVMNSSIVITPFDAKDYGVYVCHATNNFGSTAYKVTLRESQASSTSGDTTKGKDDPRYTTLKFADIALSCIIFVLLVVIAVLIWRLRRSMPNNRATTADEASNHDVDQTGLPRDQHVSEPGTYMELRATSHGQYTSLQQANKDPEYYNVGL